MNLAHVRKIARIDENWHRGFAKSVSSKFRKRVQLIHSLRFSVCFNMFERNISKIRGKLFTLVIFLIWEIVYEKKRKMLFYFNHFCNCNIEIRIISHFNAKEKLNSLKFLCLFSDLLCLLTSTEIPL